MPRELFIEVAEALCDNSGRERTSAFCYAVGWTQHTVGVQYIRTAAIIQLLLGNIGRPGGGIMALRGHASIQGSTDIPTLYNILPGYLPMPHADAHQDLAATSSATRRRTGFWGHMDAYTVSLLKAWWGDAATAENDCCFDHLPRITGDHSTYPTMMDMLDGKVQGLLRDGREPGGRLGATRRCTGWRWPSSTGWWCATSRRSRRASFWYDGPEIETGELRTEDIGTEVFFLPAAAHTEKDGTFTNTQRLLQWHHKAVEPPGDCRSELWFVYHLGRRIREKLAGSTDPTRPPGPRPHLGLPDLGPARGARRRGGAARDQRLRRRRRGAVGRTRSCADDGSTACGCWIYCGLLRRTASTRRRAAGPAGADLGRARVGLGVADEPADALQPRVGRPGGRPWSERKRYVWWDADAGRVDRRGRARLHGRQARPTTSRRRARAAPRRCAVTSRSSCRRRARLAVRAQRARRRPAADALRAARVTVRQPALRAAAEPRARAVRAPREPVQPDRANPLRGVPVRDDDLPADRAPHRRRDVAHASLPVGAAARDVLRGQPGAGGASAA